MTASPPPGRLAEILAGLLASEASLGERLAAYAKAIEDTNSPFAAAYARLIERLKRGEAGAEAPRIGEIMPDFLLTDSAGAMVTLADVLRDGPAVLSFNRGHWCPFCAIELDSLARAGADLEILRCRIVSIVPDRQAHARLIDRRSGGRVTVLTDLDNAYAASLGLAMWVGDEVRDLMQARGWSLDLYHGNDAWFLPLPATFVVAPDGRVIGRFVDADFRKRMAIEDIVRLLP